MLYSVVPEEYRANLDVETLLTEADYFYKNLPEQEHFKLQQFNSSTFCRMHSVRIYNNNLKNDRKPFNIRIDTYEKNYITNLVINKTLNDKFKNETEVLIYNELYFQKTISAIKLNKQIVCVTLLCIKPNTEIIQHTHEEKEYIVHTLLNDLDECGLQVFAENENIILNQKGQTFMHESHLPHGGKTNKSEVRLLSVCYAIEDNARLF